MRVQVNGEPRELEEGLTVAGLLALDREPSVHVLVEVNGALVPSGRHGVHRLAEGDRVEIILPAFGG